MRICMVAPRYGEEIVGGAESVVRSWAGQLAERGHQVSVLTTCALDHHTWANALPEGDIQFDGIRVTRFPVDNQPDIELLAKLIHGIECLPDRRQYDLLLNTGYSSGLLQEIKQRADDVDAFIFSPYLYPSTALGSAIAPHKSLVMPALHNEERARLHLLTDGLKQVAGLLFLSQPERALAIHLLGDLPPSSVIGAAADLPDDAHNLAKGSAGISGEFVVYAGRHEEMKNYPVLLNWMKTLQQSKPLPLITVGGSDTSRDADKPWLYRLGSVSSRRRQSVFADSLAVINLSLNESFSLVLMEAWSAGAPVIVHASCEVTRYHCEQSGGGLWIDNAAEFTEAIALLQNDLKLRAELAANGRAYVEQNYSKAAVTDRLEEAIRDIAA